MLIAPVEAIAEYYPDASAGLPARPSDASRSAPWTIEPPRGEAAHFFALLRVGIAGRRRRTKQRKPQAAMA